MSLGLQSSLTRPPRSVTGVRRVETRPYTLLHSGLGCGCLCFEEFLSYPRHFLRFSGNSRLGTCLGEG